MKRSNFGIVSIVPIPGISFNNEVPWIPHWFKHGFLISIQIEQHFQLRSFWQDVCFFNFNTRHMTQNPSHLRVHLRIDQPWADPVAGYLPWIRFSCGLSGFANLQTGGVEQFVLHCFFKLP